MFLLAHSPRAVARSQPASEGESAAYKVHFADLRSARSGGTSESAKRDTLSPPCHDPFPQRKRTQEMSLLGGMPEGGQYMGGNIEVDRILYGWCRKRVFPLEKTNDR